jgi:hypothetical protein
VPVPGITNVGSVRDEQNARIARKRNTATTALIIQGGSANLARSFPHDVLQKVSFFISLDSEN